MKLFIDEDARPTASRLRIQNAVCRGVAAIELDGAQISNDEIELTDDSRTHVVRVVCGEKTSVSEDSETNDHAARKEERATRG